MIEPSMPQLEGGCTCTAVRYRLMSGPLYDRREHWPAESLERLRRLQVNRKE